MFSVVEILGFYGSSWIYFWHIVLGFFSTILFRYMVRFRQTFLSCPTIFPPIIAPSRLSSALPKYWTRNCWKYDMNWIFAVKYIYLQFCFQWGHAVNNWLEREKVRDADFVLDVDRNYINTNLLCAGGHMAYGDVCGAYVSFIFFDIQSWFHIIYI